MRYAHTKNTQLKIANRLLGILLLLFIAIPVIAGNGHTTGTPTQTLGVMSKEVTESRLKILGYQRTDALRQDKGMYQALVTKSGKPILLDINPRTGIISEKPVANINAIRSELLRKRLVR